MLALALLAASPATAPSVVTAFVEICLSGDQSVEARLHRADAAGWQRSNTGKAGERTMAGADGIMTLQVDDTQNGDERMAACSVNVAKEVPRVVAMAVERFGFAPFLNFGMTATFFALRDGYHWQSGAALDRTAFLAAKAEGRFASIMVNNADGQAWLTMLAARPNGVRPPR